MYLFFLFLLSVIEIDLFSSFTENFRTTKIKKAYRKINRHNDEDCSICSEEEKKSRVEIKINQTKILDHYILPMKRCWICDLNFEKKADQLKHFYHFHEIECSICKETFTTSENKEKHIIRVHKCKVCGKDAFQRRSEKREHEKEHECEDVSEFEELECDICEWEIFSIMEEKREHEDKYHKCTICGTLLQNIYEKLEHQRAHGNSSE